MEYVDCPICGSPDTPREVEDEGFIYSCCNLACASNGGENWGEKRDLAAAVNFLKTERKKYVDYCFKMSPITRMSEDQQIKFAGYAQAIVDLKSFINAPKASE